MKQMKLEGFTDRVGAKTSHKIGIVGLGQYGGKIANLFAGLKDNSNRSYYDTIAVNSFIGDLKPLGNITDERKYSLIGVEGGCGRKPELAKEALRNKENQEHLLGMISKHIKNNDMYLVSAGLGGGTGTGTISTMVKVLHSGINIPLQKAGQPIKPIGAIVTLPRKAEPLAEKKNALMAIKELEGLMEQKLLKFVIFVDNEKAYRDFRKEKADNETIFDNWMDYSNCAVVTTLHEINIATNFSSDRTFDSQDLKNIFENFEGSMTFGKTKFPSTDINNSKDLIKKVIDTFHEGNVLANGFDLKKSRTAGVMIVRPENDKKITENSLDDIEEALAEEMPGALYRPVGYIDWNNPRETIIYTIAKVVEMPERAKTELNEEYTKVVESVKEDIKKDRAETGFDDVDDSIFGMNNEGTFSQDFDPFSFDIGTKGTEQEVEEMDIDSIDFDKLIP